LARRAVVAADGAQFRDDVNLMDLLNNPALQAGAIPFVVALLLGLALAATRYLALAVVSGLVAVLALTIGVTPPLPLTGVSKLWVTALVAVLIAMVLEATGVAASRRVAVAVAMGAGMAAVWMLQRVLENQATATAAWAIAAGAFALTASTTGSAIAAGATSSLRAAVIGACLGWGSGVLALLGASALLAQLGLALGTASAAVALVQMLRGREAPLGWTVVLPSAVAAALIGALASAAGELRWYCLIPLPFAPLATRLVPAGALRRPWQLAFATGMAALLPMALAVGLAWWAAASPAG
jgi:hypothetical protein